MKRVLVVGMFDSIHFSRWLMQFESTDIEIRIFPSSRFRRIDPDLLNLIQSGQLSFGKRRNRTLGRFLGYIDYIHFEILSRIGIAKTRESALRWSIETYNFDLVHLIEIQHAGYLYLNSISGSQRSYKVLTTNYGSDLIFFYRDIAHAEKIHRLLKISDYYSAECRRDYTLARELGFKGIELPIMPNAGGFSEEFISSPRVSLRNRSTLYIKGYGGIFGLGGIALDVARHLLLHYPKINVVIVSLTEDLLDPAQELLDSFKGRVTIHKVQERLDHKKILNIMSNSIMSIGVSRSDGISTTFLEALVCGAIPIQTDTSCAGEWVEKGFNANIVRPEFTEVFKAACDILDNLEKYEFLSHENMKFALEYLSSKSLKTIAQSYYTRTIETS